MEMDVTGYAGKDRERNGTGMRRHGYTGHDMQRKEERKWRRQDNVGKN